MLIKQFTANVTILVACIMINFHTNFLQIFGKKNAVKNVYETTYSTNNNSMLLLSFSINFHQKR